MFNNIYGNEKIKQILEKSINNKNISHSYLFVGTEGIGKKKIAIEFAKSILCISEEKYCNKCKSCIEFDSENNPDFSIIVPEGNSIKIEQIRQFQAKVYEKPIISEKKVYIIDDADKMTEEAQNCLLKTLEEPPEYVVIILIGTNENLFLSTIKSRCMILQFEKIANAEIKQYLKENFDLDLNNDIVNAFQGSIGNAIKLKEKEAEYKQIEKLIYDLSQKDKVDILNSAEFLYKVKEEKMEFLDYINILLLELGKKDINKFEKYANCINIVEETKKRLQNNANYDMCIDNMLFNLWEEINY